MGISHLIVVKHPMKKDPLKVNTESCQTSELFSLMGANNPGAYSQCFLHSFRENAHPFAPPNVLQRLKQTFFGVKKKELPIKRSSFVIFFLFLRRDYPDQVRRVFLSLLKIVKHPLKKDLLY